MDDCGSRCEAWVTDALQAAFAGWDFSYIEPERWQTEPLPWKYKVEVRRAFAAALSALDMGTGGGEVLASLAPFPPRLIAMEGWDRNLPVAAARLRPLGVKVIRAESEHPMPFADASFDLVINRHDGYAARELKRVLSAGGRFITQQVGGRNNADLNEMLLCPIPFEFAYWTPDYAVAELERAGLTVTRVEEALSETRVTDIGAIVYYLRAIPWQIADFSVEKYRDRLLALHRRIERDGAVVIHEHRFLIEASA